MIKWTEKDVIDAVGKAIKSVSQPQNLSPEIQRLREAVKGNKLPQRPAVR